MVLKNATIYLTFGDKNVHMQRSTAAPSRPIQFNSLHRTSCEPNFVPQCDVDATVNFQMSVSSTSDTNRAYCGRQFRKYSLSLWPRSHNHPPVL